MSDRARRAGWAALWLLLLGLLAIPVARSLRIGSDLRLFLPEAATREQELVLGGIGEGPASRLLLIALGGADTGTLASASRAMVDRLQGHPEFLRIDNGSDTTIPAFVTRYRYLLSPAMDRRRLDGPALRQALEERLQDLATPAAGMLEPMIPADPTLESLATLESWGAREGPQTLDGVWFDAAGGRALLVAQTHAAGFDPDGQQVAFDALSAAFAEIRAGAAIAMSVSGPGRFAALMKERTQRDAKRLGTTATVLLVALLLVAYRRPRVLLLAGLPLATAGLAGLAAVGIAHGSVHGITLAFGFTLIGVAQDYPIHLFSHQRRGLEPLANARELWPTLATGVASTCVAYLAFLASGVTGLAQLAWFAITGLAAAALTTRYLLPRIAGAEFADTAQSLAVQRAERWLSLPPMPHALYAVAAAACLAAAVAAPGAFWDDDLGALTPVPRELLRLDAELRRELGAPDARHLAVVSGESEQSVLERLEALTPGLESLVAAGAIGAYEHAARYVPSATRQRQRQALLPAEEELANSLAGAVRGLPYRAGIFRPFLADVARSRTLAPLELRALRATPEGSLVEGLLIAGGQEAAGLIAFSRVADPDALVQWARDTGDGLTMIDLKQESNALVVRQRERILICLALAAALLVIVVRAGLGRWRRVAAVLAPMALTSLVVLAVLRLGGQGLNLFHLISLVLAAGLGLDYALFMERAGDLRERRLRTLHAVLVCAASTFFVFALLATSGIPVLRSIGLTVAIGVAVNFLLSLMLSRGVPS